MIAHRYWRLTVGSTWDANARAQSHHIKLNDAVGGANLAVVGNGTATGSSTYGGSYGAGNAFHASTGSTGNYWFSDTTPTPHWVQWDFGAGNEQLINEVSLYSWIGSINASIKDFTVSWSDDATTWVLVVNGTTGAAESTYYAFPTVDPITATASLTAPPLTVLGYAGAVGSTTATAPTLFSYTGGRATLTAPSPVVVSAGHDAYGELAAFLTAPSPILSITTGGNVALTASAVSLAASVTGTNWGVVNVGAPAPTLGASATLTGTATASLTTADVYSLIGYSGAVCSVTLTGHPTISSTGTAGATGGAAITCPLFDLTSTATTQNSGSADLLAPSPLMGQSAQAYLVAPGATLTAIGHAVVTATYEAYAVNLKHQPKPGKEPNDEVTRYTNFPFTHIVRYKNSYFGANSTGLYLLDGTTDYASPTPTPIPWAFKTAMTDFKSPFQKTVASAYFGGRLGAAATIDLHVGEDGPQTYSYATVRTDHAQNYRQVFGKGTKARYYALGASGTGTLELDDIDLDVHTLSRRI